MASREVWDENCFPGVGEFIYEELVWNRVPDKFHQVRDLIRKDNWKLDHDISLGDN